MSVKEVKRTQNIEDDEIEIRLSDIVQFLRESRWSIIRWGIVFLVIGVLYAFAQPNEYTATVKVMPELKTSSTASGGLGDLKSLAGLAGINLNGINGASEAIRPDLYPDIVQSIPFSLYLLGQSTTTTETNQPQILQTYLIKQGNSGIGGVINTIFDNQETDELAIPRQTTATLQLTRRQEALTKIINARVSTEMDKKSGIITITSRMPDAVVAASVARQTLDYLTNYVTKYRTGKARKQVQFLTQQVDNARRRYEACELQLSSYRDRNRSLYLNTAKIEEQRLQADYILAQGVYSDLSKQLEQARIKVAEEAPIFQILEPARVPTKKSGPKRTMTVVGFMFVGIVAGLIAALIRRFLDPQSKVKA